MKSFMKISILVLAFLIVYNAAKANEPHIYKKKVVPPKKIEKPKSSGTQTDCLKKYPHLIKISCPGNFEGYGDCKYNPICVEPRDSNADEYLKTLNSSEKQYYLNMISNDGYNMSWELADKVCKAKNMRLPRAVELHYMYLAQKKGQGDNFVHVNYWAESIGESVAHNCHMRAGNCGRHYKGDLQRVRCVEK